MTTALAFGMIRAGRAASTAGALSHVADLHRAQRFGIESPRSQTCSHFRHTQQSLLTIGICPNSTTKLYQ